MSKTKVMKKMMIAVVAVMLMSGAVFAQDNVRKEAKMAAKDMKKDAKHMKKDAKRAGDDVKADAAKDMKKMNKSVKKEAKKIDNR